MKHKSYLDIMRGFSIFFIVLGHAISHSDSVEGIYKFIYSFHVCAFFIISGYLFNEKKYKFKEFIRKKFFRIMIPYFFWEIIFLIPYAIFILKRNLFRNYEIVDYIFKIIYGNGNNDALNQNTSLWFLPALFSMEILMYLFIKIFNKFNKKTRKLLLISVIFIIGIMFSSFIKIKLPWGLNTAFSFLIVFYIGYLIKEKNFLEKINIKIIFLLGMIGTISCYLNIDIVSLVEYRYGNYFFALLSGICLSITLLGISYKINSNKIIEYVGSNTMGILVFHKIVIILFQTKMGKVTNYLINSNLTIEMLMGIGVSLITIIFSLGLNKIVKRNFPYLLGSYKKEERKVEER